MRARGTAGEAGEIPPSGGADGGPMVLDAEHQEAIVEAFEAEAARASTAWRGGFGCLVIFAGAYFVALALGIARAAEDATDVWSGVIHREFYGGAVSLTRLATLDAATGLAALVAGAALMWPSSARRGHVAHRWRISAFCAAVAAGTWAAVGWFQSIVRVEEAERMTGARRHMLWLPAVASGIPLLCAYCYRLLEGTVVEARALRGYMYEHKRA